VVQYASMSVDANQETIRPLGVIGCLTAGFEVLSRSAWLVAPPVLLDLLLWLGPRLSISPLMARLIGALQGYPPVDPEMARQMATALDLLRQLGEQSNLLLLLGIFPLVGLPSLLSGRAPEPVSPLGVPRVVPVGDVMLLFTSVAVLVPVGITLGFLYLSAIAGRVHHFWPDSGQSVQTARRIGGRAVLKFLRTGAFAAVLIVGGAAYVSVLMVLVAIGTAISQFLGALIWLLGIGSGTYAAIHLLFVVHGVLLGGRGLLRAMWDSILMLRVQFTSVLGLWLLVLVIEQGLGFVWSLPSSDSWSTLVGVVGNACVATGLTVATFVFYRERIGRISSRYGHVSEGDGV
jgi:hypothetical protein